MNEQNETWWTATAEYKAAHIGKSRRRHLWEQITFLLLAPNEEEAKRIAQDIAKAKEHTYKAVGGNQIVWQLIEVLNLKKLIDQEFIPGMEVNWNFFERVDSLKAKSGD